MSDVAPIMKAQEANGTQAPDKLVQLVYEELRRLAASKLANEPAGQTLQPTALVHEAWLRLVGDEKRLFEDRTHFFAAAALAMRHILIDRARRRQSVRHGSEYDRVDLDENTLGSPQEDEQLLALHDALEKLELKHPVQAQVVQLRYFAGMSNEETAELLGVSVSTVKNYWVFAKAWLFREIKQP